MSSQSDIDPPSSASAATQRRVLRSPERIRRSFAVQLLPPVESRKRVRAVRGRGRVRHPSDGGYFALTSPAANVVPPWLWDVRRWTITPTARTGIRVFGVA
jgi:hypothetical protein